MVGLVVCFSWWGLLVRVNGWLLSSMVNVLWVVMCCCFSVFCVVCCVFRFWLVWCIFNCDIVLVLKWVCISCSVCCRCVRLVLLVLMDWLRKVSV